ncbi:DUF4269 domain-containing protein [Flavobacterium sp. B17]|uniref:DUF4269 domain-containing protein n=1 Tax=Flavobacterium sp. B17 TaxID=95618 RepID=UPI0003485AFA|nr:DUF4269 domain-containing protein [Flavobacterium sp. B17]
MIDFTTINYLKTGNQKQKRAYEILTKYRIFEKLKDFSPLLAGTIPIEIDTEESDLDIICEVDLRFKEDFLDELMFSKLIPFDGDVKVSYPILNGEKCITLSFILEDFPMKFRTK